MRKHLINEVPTVRIFTRRLALELRKRGFSILMVVPDNHKPEFDNYIFEDTTALREAMNEIIG